MNSHILTIAPLLRGLTFDGHTGAIIRASDDSHAELVIDVIRNGVVDEARLAEEFASFTRTQGRIPASVQIPDIGTLQIVMPTQVDPRDRNATVKGKIAVVTGGAQGIGEEIVRGLAAYGAHVVIADANRQGAERLAGELNSASGCDIAYAMGVDVSDEASVQTMVAEIVATLGGIDIFISNAGVLKAGSVTEMAVEDFSFVTNVNYLGYFLCVKHVAPIMAAQNRTTRRYMSDIIQINSKSGLEGSKKNGAYAGSKFGGIGLTQSFALELIESNIKVNAICPGNFFEGPLWSDPTKGLFVQYLQAGKVPGAQSVADVRRHYEQKVPLQRGCRGEDVLKAIFYIVEQSYETGQAVPVTGGQIMLH